MRISPPRVEVNMMAPGCLNYRWSTPARDDKDFAGRRVQTSGEAIWHKPEGDFACTQFTLREIEYNVDVPETYRPRHPERKVLYRVLFHNFDLFLTVYDSEHLLTFSCMTRGFCPSCHAKRREEWGQWMRETLLLDVPHRQVVLTIPKTLRIFFKYRRRLLGELSRAPAAASTPVDVFLI